METCTDDDWESKVRQLAIELAQTTLPALTRMGPTIGALACATVVQTTFKVPAAVAGEAGWEATVALQLCFATLDWTGALEPAKVSSRCSAFVDQLNDLLSCIGMTDSIHKRVFPLECFLEKKNRGQGIEFTIFGVKVDRWLLMQIAIFLSTPLQ